MDNRTMKELEELQKKAEELAAGLEQVNKQIEELKNHPIITEFDKLPYETICLVEHLDYEGTRLAFKFKNNLVKVVDGCLSYQWPNVHNNLIEKGQFNLNYTFVKVVDLS